MECRDSSRTLAYADAQLIQVSARSASDGFTGEPDQRTKHIRALESLPEKLSDTLHDAIRRAAAQPEVHAALAAQVTSWIFYARRHLSVAELHETLSVEVVDTRLDRSRCHEVDLSLNVCCGFISMDQEDSVFRLKIRGLGSLRIRGACADHG